MREQFSNTKTVTIGASPDLVWRALTDNEMIKRYFFGVDYSGDWKEGNTITSKGQWKGKSFTGKAKVLQVETQKLLKHSYWSDLSGHPDVPENYHIITYQLQPDGEGTKLLLTEENLESADMKEQSSRLWDTVLESLKKLVESQKMNYTHSR